MTDEKSRFSRKNNDAKRMRKISPLGFRVLIKVEKEAAQTDSGLYLPEGAKQLMMDSLQGQVVEVASATDHHSEEETNISGIPLGARVLIPKNAGIKIPWDETMRLVETKDVLAVVEEISVT